MDDYKELVARLNRQYTISQFAYVEQLYDAMNAERKQAAEAIERLSAALHKINGIRNSIIGCQTVNWSEHVYPLVAALDEAGIIGDGYDTARKNVGTLLERNKRLEEELAALKKQLHNPDWVCLEGMSASEIAAFDYGSKSMMSALRRLLDGSDKGKGVSNEPWESLKREVLSLVALKSTNELLLQWKGEIDQRRISLGLDFPDDYDYSPKYAVKTLLDAALKSASAEPVAWEYRTYNPKRDSVKWHVTYSLEEAKASDQCPVPLFHPAPVRQDDATLAAVPEGWQLVPKEPTEEMLAALEEHGMCYDECNNSWFAPLDAYLGMLAAAPKPEGEKT